MSWMMDKISTESLEDLPNIHLHSKSQKHFLNKHRHASLISVSLVPITPLLGDLRFYYPIAYFSVICHSEGYNWNTALSSLSRNHGNSAGRSGLNAPGCLVGMTDSLATAISYRVPFQTCPFILLAIVC